MPPRKKVDESTGNWLQKWGGLIPTISEMEHDIETIPTGSLTLDLGLAHGGWPIGCLARIYGKKGTMKTTLCQRTAVNALNKGMNVLWIDAETSFIPFIARANGLPADDPRFRVWRNDPTAKTKLTYENMAKIVEAWVLDEEWSPNGCLIIIDSLSAIVTEKQLAGNIEDKQIASVSSLNSRWFPTFLPLLEKRHSTMIAIQQMRANFNSIGWGAEQTDPGGGWALQHYTSVEIKLGFAKKENSAELAKPIMFDIRANRFAYSGIRDTFFFRNDYGIDTPRELIKLAETYGLLTKKTSSYTFHTLPQIGALVGIENARSFLLEHPEYMDELEKQIRDAAKVIPLATGDAEEDVTIDVPESSDS